MGGMHTSYNVIAKEYSSEEGRSQRLSFARASLFDLFDAVCLISLHKICSLTYNARKGDGFGSHRWWHYHAFLRL
jgi:hypothetical protein